MFRYSKIACQIIFIGFFLFHGSASAKQNKSVLDNVYQCTVIADATERLYCFDNAVSSLRVKEENKEIVAIDAEQVKEIKRDSFGFSLPSLPKIGLFGKNDEKEEKAAQVFKVKSIVKRRSGAIITLENGHVWQHTSGDLGRIPKGNVTATIKPASLGSFFVRLENEKGHSGRKGAKIKRIK